ncbi:MAG: electron transport complex subunit RsxC [Halieaceae bacterium]
MRKIWDFHGGVHPAENKLQSLQCDISSAGIPPQLTFPLSQHIGAPAEPIVEVGEKVRKGQKIAEARGFISVPVHASTSGTISAIEDRLIAHASGLSAPCIVLDSDGQDEWISHQGTEDYSKLEKAELLKIIRDAGIAGMGGAGFPTAVKLAVNPDAHKIQTLIINGTECEPYITADDVLMRERAADIIAGAEILRHILNPDEVLIGVEDNKGAAAAALKGAVRNSGSSVEIVTFPTKYPSGGEKQLIEILTGKQVPSGGLPSELGIVCQNVGSVVAIYRAVVHGEPLISRITTVTGAAVAQAQNFEVLLGSPMSYLLQLAGFQPERCARLVMGGPMMGFTVADHEVPVVKTTNCLLAPTAEELPAPDPAQACIRCGLCAEACPASLLPQQLYWFARSREYEKLAAHNLFDCIECGACSYACPSHIPLVQYYRAGKAEVTQMRHDQAKSEHSRTRFEARQERLERDAAAKEAQRAARKQAAEERARQAASEGQEDADPIQAAIERAQAKKAASQASVDGEAGPKTETSQAADTEQAATTQADTAQPDAAQPDAAQLAIERARAARAESAEQSPLEKANSKLQRLQERQAKSEAKLQQSREDGAAENIIEALESALEKLAPKIAAAEQELKALQEESEG